MNDRTNHEKLEEQELLTGEWPDHHKDAINSLSDEETQQLIGILQKLKDNLPEGRRQDSAYVF